jgi:hypothetical protein
MTTKGLNIQLKRRFVETKLSPIGEIRERLRIATEKATETKKAEEEAAQKEAEEEHAQKESQNGVIPLFL